MTSVSYKNIMEPRNFNAGEVWRIHERALQGRVKYAGIYLVLDVECLDFHRKELRLNLLNLNTGNQHRVFYIDKKDWAYFTRVDNAEI